MGKLGVTNLDTRYLCPQMVRGLLLGLIKTVGMVPRLDMLGCMTGLDHRGQSWVLT